MRSARLTPPAVAASAPDTGRTLAQSTAQSLIRIALGAGVLLLGFALVAAWARSRSRARAGPDGNIEVLAVRGLGPRHRIALVEVGPHRLLVGMGADHICTLLDLSDTADFPGALAELAPEAPPPLLSGIGPFEGLDA